MITLQNYKHEGSIGTVVLQQMVDGRWYVERQMDCDGHHWERLYTGDEDTARQVYAEQRTSVD